MAVKSKFPEIWDIKMKRRIECLFDQGGTLIEAAREMGISRSTLLTMREESYSSKGVLLKTKEMKYTNIDGFDLVKEINVVNVKTKHETHLKFEKMVLNSGIKDKDFTEVIDALGDILYVVYGSGSSFGIDLDKAFDLIHKSNMTKLCKSEEEAIQTVEWYKENETRYDTPAYRLSDDKKYYVVYNESTGKILKSINYKPVKFDSIFS